MQICAHAASSSPDVGATAAASYEPTGTLSTDCRGLDYASWAPADLRELGDVHAAIAGATARLAASRASESEIARLRDIVDRLSTSRQEAQQRRLDGRFYVEIAASAQSVRLTLAEIDIQSELGQTPWPAEGSAPRFTETLQAHRRVIAAIAAHDGDRARSLAEDHLAARTRWLVEMRLQLGAVAPPSTLVPLANGAPAEETSR